MLNTKGISVSLLFLPRVSLGQIICVGVYQVYGEEPWSCRTCRALHTYILVITAQFWFTKHFTSHLLLR